VGEYVAALSAHDGKYYRAVINEIEADRADLKFVDYGEDAFVALTDLRKLPWVVIRFSALLFFPIWLIFIQGELFSSVAASDWVQIG